MLVSVVIPTKDRPTAVVDAVQSVFAGRYQQFELFVIDQSAGEETRDALAQFMVDSRFHYRQNRRPGYGAASSRNVGIALSSGEVVAIIDDDVTVQPDWMEQIVAEFSADPELQFICGKLTAPPYDPTKGYTPAFEPNSSITSWNLIYVVAGANISMRRSLFDRIGGYDEFCGPGSRLRASDDGDIALRIVRSGAKWKACPHIEVIHTHGFRPGPAGPALLVRYSYGTGGLFGRFTRRGDLLVGLYFILKEGRHLQQALFNLLRGHGSVGFEYSRARLRGFWNGFKLPPNEGFVSGQELARRRAMLSRETPIQAMPAVPSLVEQ